MNKQKLTMDSLAESAAGTQQAYEKMYKSLTTQADQYEKYADKQLSSNPNYTPQEHDALSKRVEQMQQLAKDYKAVRDKAVEEAKATATENGYSEKYVDNLIKKGESLSAVASLTQSATQKEQNEANAQTMLAQSITNANNARVNAANAASSYNQIANATASAIAQITNETDGSKLSWDEQTNSISTANKAGQDAVAMFSNLYTANQSYVQAMIANGESQSTVNKQVSTYNDKLREMGKQLGLGKTQVDELIATYGMTPQEVTTLFKVEAAQAKADCLNYLNLIRQTFKTNNEATYDVIMNAITDGAVTNISQVDSLAQKFTKHEWKATLTANGDVAIDVGDKVANSILRIPEARNAYLTATVEGKNNVDALSAAVEAVPELKNTYQNAITSGKSDVDALKEAIQSVPVAWDAYQKAITSGKGDVDALDAAIRAIPDQKNQSTRAYVSGTNDVNALHEAIKNLHDKNVSVNVSVNRYVKGAIDTQVGAGLTNATGYSVGGRIFGPGTSTSDSIPAMLSNGEYVIKAASVRKLEAAYGKGFLNTVNTSGTIPSLDSRYIVQAQRQARMPGHYANGGKVTGGNGFGGTVVNNTTFNMPTKIVRTNDDLPSSAQIMQSSLLNKARALSY